MIRIGIVDIGSNSIRLVIAQIHGNNSFSIIDEVKETIRLGKDMNLKGQLNPMRIDKTISVLSFFKRLCTSQNVKHTIIVATEAVRKAANQTEFLNRVRNELNMEIRVLSGKEEAYYDYFGTINSIDFSDALLLDIGGSSTELIWVQGRQLRESISLPIGALTLTEKFSLSHPIDENTEAELIDFLLSYYDDIPWLKNLKNIKLIGIGGSIRNIARINQKAQDYPLDNLHNYEMTSNEVKNIYESVKHKNYSQRKKIKGLSKDRADIFLGPMASVVTLQKFVNSDELCISSSGIRDGLLYEYILHKEIPLNDVLDFSLNNHILNFELDKIHALKVWSLTEILYNDLKLLIDILPSESIYKILKTSSLLHDCGIRISYYDHHKHSFYIILNSKINGLSHKEQIISSYVAASHRKNTLKINSEHYAKIINKNDIEIIEKLSILLRISENLDRAMNGNIHKINCSISEKEVVIDITSKNDALLEINSVLEAAPAFEKIFNKKLVIK
ncbi:exopolyphosphatase [Clostridium sp. WILCCON 0269]|uniref:Exopolyphosphatase n=1 Tax=Candidatus Clostridium eludens TaxID=3381663 RepID=A0ABW8SMZ9_9CLOT